MRKGLLVGVALITLFSCSPYYHIKQAKKHTQKAIVKGATVETDTTYITKSDTLTEIDTVDNYIRITKTIRDTLYIQGETRYIAKSRTEVRQEQRTARKQIKQEQKTERAKEKQKTKQAKRAAKKRSLWLFWLGLAVGCGIMILLNQFKSYLKTYLWN